MSVSFWLLCALVPAAVSAGFFLWWAHGVRQSRGKVGPVGHIHSMALVFGVFAPSLFAWSVWLLWGLLTWLQA